MTVHAFISKELAADYLIEKIEKDRMFQIKNTIVNGLDSSFNASPIYKRGKTSHWRNPVLGNLEFKNDDELPDHIKSSAESFLFSVYEHTMERCERICEMRNADEEKKEHYLKVQKVEDDLKLLAELKALYPDAK
jgi:hypothetical protein